MYSAERNMKKTDEKMTAYSVHQQRISLCCCDVTISNRSKPGGNFLQSSVLQ
jgi:hypothetical protein